MPTSAKEGAALAVLAILAICSGDVAAATPSSPPAVNDSAAHARSTTPIEAPGGEPVCVALRRAILCGDRANACASTARLLSGERIFIENFDSGPYALFENWLDFAWRNVVNPAGYHPTYWLWTGSRQQRATAKRGFRERFNNDVEDGSGGAYELRADIDNDGRLDRIVYLAGVGRESTLLLPVLAGGGSQNLLEDGVSEARSSLIFGRKLRPHADAGTRVLRAPPDSLRPDLAYPISDEYSNGVYYVATAGDRTYVAFMTFKSGELPLMPVGIESTTLYTYLTIDGRTSQACQLAM